MATMTGTQAMIFDLDGVLVDTVDLHYHSWRFLAEQHGIPFSWDDMADFRGRQRRDCLLSLFRGRALTEAQIATYLEIKNEHYLTRLNTMPPRQLLLPHATRLIENAVARGIRLGVASSSANAVRVLRHVNLYHRFEVVADGGTVFRSKPAPDIFLWAAGALGIHPARCVVFEDSKAGILAARECGMVAIGVGQKTHLRHAHLVLPDLGAMSLENILEAVQQIQTCQPSLTSEAEEARC